MPEDVVLKLTPAQAQLVFSVLQGELEAAQEDQSDAGANDPDRLAETTSYVAEITEVLEVVRRA